MDAARLITTLTERSQTLAVAESLTGGLMGATLTAVPGASKVFRGGIISYATDVKTSLLEVDEGLIEAQTVISEAVATAMAAGARRALDADWALAVTGVAGPDPQDGHSPGEVWIGIAGPPVAQLGGVLMAEQHRFDGDREAIRHQTVEAACALALRVLSPV